VGYLALDLWVVFNEHDNKPRQQDATTNPQRYFNYVAHYLPRSITLHHQLQPTPYKIFNSFPENYLALLCFIRTRLAVRVSDFF